MLRRKKSRVSRVRSPSILHVLEMSDDAGNRLAIHGMEAGGRDHFMTLSRHQAAALAVTLLRHVTDPELQHLWNESAEDRSLVDSRAIVLSRLADVEKLMNDFQNNRTD